MEKMEGELLWHPSMLDFGFESGQIEVKQFGFWDVGF